MLKNLRDNANKIRKIIFSYLGFYSEDIEQEVYIKAIKNKDKYNEQNKFSSWISIVTANICKDYLKNSKFKMSQNSTSDEVVLDNLKTADTPEKVYTRKERQRIILKAINSLPPKMKQTIILFEFENLSYEEIAKKLKIPIGTVKSRINNARKILAEKLKCLLDDE